MSEFISKEQLETFLHNRAVEFNQILHRGYVPEAYFKGKLDMIESIKTHFLKVKSFEVIVKASEGDWDVWFLETFKVKELIEQVRCHFGYVEDGKYEITYKGCKLHNECTFEGVNLKDGDTLHFSDLGGSV